MRSRRRAGGHVLEEPPMTQYLISMYQPDGDPPPRERLEPIMREVEAVTTEMKAAGAGGFSGGLHPASTATVLRVKAGDGLVTDGPYVEGKEPLGGFTIVEAPDLDAALEWGRKFARAIGLLPIEVRPFQARPGG